MSSQEGPRYYSGGSTWKGREERRMCLLGTSCHTLSNTIALVTMNSFDLIAKDSQLLGCDGTCRQCACYLGSLPIWHDLVLQMGT